MDEPLAETEQNATLRVSPAAVEVAVLALTAPFLLAAGQVARPLSLAALVVLAVPFVLRRLRTGSFSRPTVLNLPVAVLSLIFLPVAMLVSPAAWTITWPRVAGLAWSVALFFTVANWPSPDRSSRRHRGGRTRLNGPTRVYLVLGGLFALAAPLVMRSVDKLFYLPQTGWLADHLGWEGGLPTNEVAGVLTLFVPFVAALLGGALWTGRRRLSLALSPLLLVLLVALVLAQSRTALAASAIGVLLALAVGARLSWKGALVGLAGGAVALLVIVLSPLRDWIVFAGANSWQSVVGPRLGIWGQALDGIRDHPVWGMGLGAFGQLARVVYPLVAPEQASAIEDAHNLYFQSALDLGLLGALLFVLLLGVAAAAAVALATTRPPRSLSRLWAAGLLGALAAHALYSLTDAVALGTPGGAALWYVLGLIMGGTAPLTAFDRVASPLRRWSPAAIAAAAVVVLGVLLWTALPVNRAGQLAARALLDAREATPQRAAEAAGMAAARCRAGWYDGLIAGAAGDAGGRSAAWSDLLGCTPDYTAYMAMLAPDDETLARQALAAQPDNAAAYFWLAAIQAPHAPVEAIALYRQGLALSPRDGWRWLALARLLAGRDDAASLAAYLQVCLNGDPGANGCAHAAAIVEAQGDLETAIRYYRLSNWEEAQRRADELESELSKQ